MLTILVSVYRVKAPHFTLILSSCQHSVQQITIQGKLQYMESVFSIYLVLSCETYNWNWRAYYTYKEGPKINEKPILLDLICMHKGRE